MAYLTWDSGHRYKGRVADGRERFQAIDPYVDVTDPATLGCILSLVRELWGRPNAYTCTEYGHWHVSSGEDCAWELQAELSSDGFSRYPTEVEALLAAVQGAPVVP